MFNQEHDEFIHKCVTVVRLVDAKQEKTKWWRREVRLGGSWIFVGMCVAMQN